MQVAMATQGGRLHADFLPDFLFPMDLLEASGNAHAEDPQKKEAHRHAHMHPTLASTGFNSGTTPLHHALPTDRHLLLPS
jgi:hypothetical protein